MGSEFPITDWSLVVALRNGQEETQLKALQTICEDYWQPVNRYIRTWDLPGRPLPAPAEDLTQDFFTQLLRTGLFQKANSDEGRLRSLILAALKNFLMNSLRDANAQKRGGSVSHQELEPGEVDPLAEMPDKAFDRRWARHLLDVGAQKLKDQYVLRDRSAIFDLLFPFLEERAESSLYKRLEEENQISSSKLAVEMFRLRERYRNIIIREVARTVSAADAIENELDYLRDLLKG